MPHSSEAGASPAAASGESPALRGGSIRGRLRRAWLTLTMVASLSACVHGGDSDHVQVRPVLDVTLANPDRTTFELAELRGRPLLVFLFATYDGNSQLALTHLEALLVHEKRLPVLGIALQPDAAQFLEPYRAALSVTFPLAYDPEGALLAGKTELGTVRAVPSFVLLDGEGHVLGTRTGIVREAELRDFIGPVLP